MKCCIKNKAKMSLLSLYACQIFRHMNIVLQTNYRFAKIQKPLLNLVMMALYNNKRFIMSKETYLKTVLRSINSHNIEDYLTPASVRQELGYPRACCMQTEEMKQSSSQSNIIGIGFCDDISDRLDKRLKVVICNSNYETVFCQSFGFRGDDLLCMPQKIQSLIWGKIVVGYDMGKMLRRLDLQHNRFIDLVHLCPHGLGLPNKIKLQALCIQMLNLNLSQLQNPRGRRRRSYRDYNNPLVGLRFDPDMEDMRRRGYRQQERQDEQKEILQNLIGQTIAAIKIAQKHIANGSGIVTSITSQKKNYQHIQEIRQILREAEIDRNLVCGLYLRGSRALGIEILTQQYSSDWDYICILNTPAVINSILVKLHNVDLILLDKRTASILLNANDMPMIELFYLPENCVMVNQMKRPIVDLVCLKKSLIYHLRKVDQKIQYFSQEFYRYHMHPKRKWHKRDQDRGGKEHEKRAERKEFGEREREREREYRGFYPRGRMRGGYGRPTREQRQKPKPIIEHPLLIQVQSNFKSSKNSNPDFIKWKFMKAMHLQVRFLDEYLQFKEYNCIKDIKRTVPFWKELIDICQTKGFQAGFKVCSQHIFKLLNLAFSDFELKWLKFKFFMVKDQKFAINDQLNEYRYQIFQYFISQGRRGSYQGPPITKKTLSIYRSNITQSSNDLRSRYTSNQIIQRIDDINDDLIQFMGQTRYSDRQSNCIVFKHSSAEMIQRGNLQVYKLFMNKEPMDVRGEKYLFAQYFVQIRHYYEIQYVRKGKEEDDKEFGELFSLTNFILKENANQNLPLVREVKSSIYKSHITHLQRKSTVRNLVCLKYTNLFHYQKDGNNGEFNFQQFQISQKRDGVLAVLYFIGGGWVVSSKETPDGREYVYDDVTFRDQFVRVFYQMDYRLPEREDENKVFLFELLSTRIKNVIPKQKDELILHGVRNMTTLVEENPSGFGYHYAQKLDLGTKDIEDIARIAQNRNDFQGFVLRDSKFNRVIIQNHQFLKNKWNKELRALLSEPIHHFIEKNLDNNRKLYFIYSQIILKNREKEYKKAFPQDSKLVDIILNYIKQVNEQCESLRLLTKGFQLKSAAMNEIISDRRIDVLNYLFGSCNTAHPQNFTNRNHTSVNFLQTFNYILQQISHKQLKGQL